MVPEARLAPEAFGLQLTAIGTSPAWYNAGQPTTGYLLEQDGFRVLVDCGLGVISRYLEEFGSAAPLDAIVITHAHPDHVFDLVPLKYGMQHGQLAHWRPQLWLPPGCHDRLRRLVASFDGAPGFFADVYDVQEYSPARGFAVGPFTCSSLEVPHFIEAWALRFDVHGASFGYTSDLGPAPHVAPFMQDVDLLLAEATLPEEHHEDPDNRGHLTASEAGRIAHDSSARSLLLTHVPEALDAGGVLAAARTVFAGPVAIASPMQTYAIAQHLAHVG